MVGPYILDNEFRDIIDRGNFAYLNVTPYGEAFQNAVSLTMKSYSGIHQRFCTAK